jgi:hypothetical protein
VLVFHALVLVFHALVLVFHALVLVFHALVLVFHALVLVFHALLACANNTSSLTFKLGWAREIEKQVSKSHVSIDLRPDPESHRV